MMKTTLKFDGKCKVCKTSMSAGDSGWLQKSPTTGRWEVYCPKCIASGSAVAGFHDAPGAKIAIEPKIALMTDLDDFLAEKAEPKSDPEVMTAEALEYIRAANGLAHGAMAGDGLNALLKAAGLPSLEEQMNKYCADDRPFIEDALIGEKLANSEQPPAPEKPAGPKMTMTEIKKTAPWSMAS